MTTPIAHRHHNELAATTAGLIAFAEHDERVAHILAEIAYSLPGSTATRICSQPAPYLEPRNRDIALRRALWLQQELQLANPRTTQTARELLVSFVRHSDIPQDIILGIVGMAIIGPTLGLVEKKKKKKSQMRIVLHYSYQDAPLAQSLSVAHRASTSLLGNQLAAVRGNANRLDPELADWLYTDQEVRLFTSNYGQLAELNQLLNAERLPHFTLHTDGLVDAIAIAPAVNETLTVGDPLDAEIDSN